MATTDQPTTFTELYTALLNRVRADTSVSATVVQAKRYINVALHDLHIGFGESFPWAERSDVLRLKAPYSTGTVSISKGSTSLTGVSTLWNTNNDFSEKNVIAGGKIVLGGPDIYQVSAVGSDTAITLTEPFISDTLAAGTSYRYFEDEYDLNADFLRPLDLRRFSSAADIRLMDRRDFRRAFPRNHIVGIPRVAMIIDRVPAADATITRRIRFHRPPSTTILVPYTFVTNKLAIASNGTEAANLSGDTDEPIVPVIYRHILILHALKNWYRDKKDDVRSGEVQGEWVDLMKRITGDQEIGAKRPVIRPRVAPIVQRARRPWHGTAGRRHVTGSRFDELR